MKQKSIIASLVRALGCLMVNGLWLAATPAWADGTPPQITWDDDDYSTTYGDTVYTTVEDVFFIFYASDGEVDTPSCDQPDNPQPKKESQDGDDDPECDYWPDGDPYYDWEYTGLDALLDDMTSELWMDCSQIGWAQITVTEYQDFQSECCDDDTEDSGESDPIFLVVEKLKLAADKSVCLCNGSATLDLTGDSWAEEKYWEIEADNGGTAEIDPDTGEVTWIADDDTAVDTYTVYVNSVNNYDNCWDKARLNIVKVESLLPDTYTIEVPLDNSNPLNPQIDPNNRLFVVDADEENVVTVTATPSPNIPESKLPQSWSLTGGDGTSKLTRTIDCSTPSKTIIICSCGESAKTATVYVVACSWTALADGKGFVGHAWWYFGIQPASAVDDIIDPLSKGQYDQVVNIAAGFYPKNRAAHRYSNVLGQVFLGLQPNGDKGYHVATGQYAWTFKQPIFFNFKEFMQGSQACYNLYRNAGIYDLKTRNCVWGTCDMGLSCPVENPGMHKFSYPGVMLIPSKAFGFWTPQQLSSWLANLAK